MVRVQYCPPQDAFMEGVFFKGKEVKRMLKYAFIINVPGIVPGSYQAIYENSESLSQIVGVDGMLEAEKLVIQLGKDGFDLLNFCGDFDDAITSRFGEISGGKTKCLNVKHSEENLGGMESLGEDLKEYGILVVMRGVVEPVRYDLLSEGWNTHAVFVRDLEDAVSTARKMKEEGIQLIELCSWFDEEKTRAIEKAVEGKVIVGTSGS